MDLLMRVFSKEGLELLDVKSIVMEGDNLLVKGKVMNSMAVTMAIKPEDCWDLVKQLGFGMILKLPGMLVKGFFRSRKKASATAAK